MAYRKNVCLCDKIYCPDGYASCPICGGPLEKQYDVDEDLGFKPYPPQSDFPDIINEDISSSLAYDDSSFSNKDVSVKSKKISVSGVVHNYYMNPNDYRNIFRKIGDYFRHGQVMSNTAHSFMVSEHGTHQDYPITCYGKIAARGARIADGTQAEVVGILNHEGVIIAKKVLIGGRKVLLHNDGKDDVNRLNLSAISLIFIIVMILAMLMAAFMVPAVRSFLLMWLLMFIIVEASFLFIRPLHMLASKPLIAVSGGLIVTLLLYNIGGIGDIFGAYVYAIGPAVIIIGVLIYMVKSIFR